MYRVCVRFVVGASTLLFAATAHAQEASGSTRSFTLGGTLGASIPLGNFGDGADVGFHLGGLLEYKPAAVPLSLRGEITYHRFGLESDFFSDTRPAFGAIDGNFGMLDLIGNVLVPLRGAASIARPYAIGGLGLYRLRAGAKLAGEDIDYKQTKFGLNVGGGVNFDLSGFETFVEARFHKVLVEDIKMHLVPITFGFKF